MIDSWYYFNPCLQKFKKKVSLNSPPIMYTINFEFMNCGTKFRSSATFTALETHVFIYQITVWRSFKFNFIAWKIVRYYYIRLVVRFIHFDLNIELIIIISLLLVSIIYYLMFLNFLNLNITQYTKKIVVCDILVTLYYCPNFILEEESYHVYILVDINTNYWS